MILISLLLASFLSTAQVPTQVHSGPLRVVILDTGLTPAAQLELPLCKSGHRNFGNGLPNNIGDSSGHGTSVARLIAANAGHAHYCLIIVRIFGTDDRIFSWTGYSAALHYVQSLEPDIINASYSGPVPFYDEQAIFGALLSRGTHIFVAAGNKSTYLGPRKCEAYPACTDRRLTVVGAYGPYSNWGPIVDIYKRPPTPAGATSFATAIATGEFLSEAYKQNLLKRVQK